MQPVEAYENFILAKEEFLNSIAIVSSLLIASPYGEIPYNFAYGLNGCAFSFQGNEIRGGIPYLKQANTANTAAYG